MNAIQKQSASLLADASRNEAHDCFQGIQATVEDLVQTIDAIPEVLRDAMDEERVELLLDLGTALDKFLEES